MNEFPLTQALIRSAGFDVERRLTKDPRYPKVGSASKAAPEPQTADDWFDLTMVEAFDKAVAAQTRAPRKSPDLPVHPRWNDPEYWADRLAYFRYRDDQEQKKAAT